MRLVFDGQFMEKGYDYSSSFSPVVKMDTFKLRMALKALNPKYKHFGLDFITAFLQAILHETHLYGYFPKGYVVVDIYVYYGKSCDYQFHHMKTHVFWA